MRRRVWGCLNGRHSLLEKKEISMLDSPSLLQVSFLNPHLCSPSNWSGHREEEEELLNSYSVQKWSSRLQGFHVKRVLPQRSQNNCIFCHCAVVSHQHFSLLAKSIMYHCKGNERRLSGVWWSPKFIFVLLGLNAVYLGQFNFFGSKQFLSFKQISVILMSILFDSSCSQEHI